MFEGTFWSLVPAVVAIALALITKEVYSSLFLGIVCGGLLYSGFSFTGTVEHVLNDGIIASLADAYNVGILIFLVVLGGMVMLMNRAGGSAAFGRWAASHIKTEFGALMATMALGILIFIDDYFNCLTVGSVMMPVTDKHRISRAKLAYIIDATAAPICIIAPVSSWAAAVSGFVEGANGLELFIRAIPYNFYAFLSIVMIITISKMNFDYGPMSLVEMTSRLEASKKHVESPTKGEDQPDPPISANGKVIHLVLPIVVLIASSVIGLIYSGGFFAGESFIDAFSNADASVGLSIGSIFALIFTIIFYLCTRVLNFSECMNAIPEGFKSMVPAILILTFAWSLKAMTDSLGARDYVAGIVAGFAGNHAIMSLIPAIVFIIGALLAFATGTSWGTFGVLIPIVVSVFGGDMGNELMIVSISACMAGAVCGDHCSPISDTTIMASAGAECDHIQHVSTQLPYAITVAIVSCVCYIFSGFIRNWVICLPLSIILMVATLMVMKNFMSAKSES
ncbi:MAG: Na+/H+ antiporter NhaC family protein [Pseudobutyrivibrio sp.]|mgnify:FL=1|nr:Na+/H+ antiporter NhaC family protein [Pseudobutyrivibrio sp.]